MDLYLFFYLTSLSLLSIVCCNPPTYNNFTKNEAEVDQWQNQINNLDANDALGKLDIMTEIFIGRIVKDAILPNKLTCATVKLNIGDEEVFVSELPKGNCAHCCPLTSRHKFVNLLTPTNSECLNFTLLKYKHRGSLNDSGINSNLPTIIYIHGFMESAKTFHSKLICDSYKSRKESYNIIVVDWSPLSVFPWYRQAVANTHYVANAISNFIKFYIETGELSISKLHVIGFSLGGQIAGFVGKHFLTDKIPRITALDPAYPLFPIEDESERLCKDDAKYVDIIHTDPGKFGFPISIGDADFYPNNKSAVQPGCTEAVSTASTFGACSHLRAIDFYAESVKNPEAFKITTADRCVYMGFYSEKRMVHKRWYMLQKSKPTLKLILAQDYTSETSKMSYIGFVLFGNIVAFFLLDQIVNFCK